MCESCCCGLIIGALLASIALIVILMLWLYRRKSIKYIVKLNEIENE